MKPKPLSPAMLAVIDKMQAGRRLCAYGTYPYTMAYITTLPHGTEDVNWRTAQALRRRGLITPEKKMLGSSYSWLRLTKAGREI